MNEIKDLFIFEVEYQSSKSKNSLFVIFIILIDELLVQMLTID